MLSTFLLLLNIRFLCCSVSLSGSPTVPSTIDLSLVAAAASPMVVHNHGPPLGHALSECSRICPSLPPVHTWGE